MLNLAILLQVTTVVSLEWLIGTTISLLILIGGAWVSMKLNVAKIETELTGLRLSLNEEKTANKELFNKIDNKLDKILEHQSEVKVQLERKEDKK